MFLPKTNLFSHLRLAYPPAYPFVRSPVQLPPPPTARRAMALRGPGRPCRSCCEPRQPVPLKLLRGAVAEAPPLMALASTTTAAVTASSSPPCPASSLAPPTHRAQELENYPRACNYHRFVVRLCARLCLCHYRRGIWGSLVKADSLDETCAMFRVQYRQSILLGRLINHV